jgi:type II secretory pathway component PulK
LRRPQKAARPWLQIDFAQRGCRAALHACIERRFNPGMQRSIMDNEQEKVAATRAAPVPQDTVAEKARAAAEARRLQDVLEDDDVRESLKELHAHKARNG